MDVLNKPTLAKAILVACSLLLVYSIASTSIILVSPTSLGLFSEFHPTYYLGLFLLACLWFVGYRQKAYLPAALILTVSYLYVAPTLIRGPVWISNSYYPYGESLLISSYGHLIYNPAEVMVSYHFWPSFLYFASAFTMITGLPHEVILKAFPLLTVSIYALLALLILRIKLPTNQAFLGSGLVLASLFIRQQYFGPQAIAYAYFLAVLLIVTLLFFDDSSSPRSLVALLLSLIVVTTLTHPLTSFLIVALLVSLFLANRLTTRRGTIRFGRLFLAAAVIWFVYNAFAGSSFFNTAISRYYEILLGKRPISITTAASRPIGSIAMQINFYSSYAIVGLVAAAAGVSLILMIRKMRHKHSETGFPLFNVILLIACASFAFGGEYGAVEAYQRAFMFGLVPIAFLVVSLLGSRPRILLPLLMIVLFLNIPAQYGSDTFRSATNSQLTGDAFIAEKAPDKIYLIGEFTLYIRYYEPTKKYDVIDIGLSPPFTNISNMTYINHMLTKADYVLMSVLQHNLYLFYIGRDPLEQADLDSLNQIYDNGGFQLLRPANATNK